VIAVDTNVIVRLLVGDDRAQFTKARRLFEERSGQDGAIWVAQTVLVEMAWVLMRTYCRSRADVAGALRALASNATVALEEAASVADALALFETGSADLADCLLAARAARQEVEFLATFDRGMRSLPGVKLL
jgi:predicted nucleic-acid-binding protein